MVSEKPLGQIPPAPYPNHSLEIDFAGPFHEFPSSTRYLLVAVDRFSHYPTLHPCSNKDSTTIISFLREYISTNGVPSWISSDQGTGFVSSHVADFCSHMGINQRFSPTFDHRGTGKVERLIRTVRERILATYLSHRRSNTPFVASPTIAVIQRTLRWIRTRLCHGLSPFHLHFGRPPQTTFSNLPTPVASTLPHHWCNVLNQCLRLDRKGTPLTCKVDWFNLDVDSSTDDDGASPLSPPRTKKTPAAKKAPNTKAPPKTTAAKQPTADEGEHILSDDTGENFAIRSSTQYFPPPGYLWRKIFPRSKMQARYRPVTAHPTTQSEHTLTFGSHNVVRKNHFALGPSTAWSAVPVKLESSSSAPTRAKPQKPGPVTTTIPTTLTNSGPSRNLYDYAARKTVAPRGRGTNRRKAAVPVKNARTPIPPPESPSPPEQHCLHHLRQYLPIAVNPAHRL